MEKDPLADANARFIKHRLKIRKDMKMVERFENFLLRLECIEKDTRLVYLDWDGHMEYVWESYEKRVLNEQEKNNKTK